MSNYLRNWSRERRKVGARPVKDSEDGLGAVHGGESGGKQPCGVTSISGLSMLVLNEEWAVRSS